MVIGELIRVAQLPEEWRLVARQIKEARKLLKGDSNG
jgi:hypothetical protein